MAQTQADSISIVFPKILVTNAKQEVLLYYDKNRQAYEVPSNGTVDGPISYKTYVNQALNDMGIEFQNFRMGGLFTYIFPNEYATFIRPYFVVDFVAYTNKNGLTDSCYKWFSFKDAIAAIQYPASAMITDKVLNSPGVVWGATFEEYGYKNPVDRSKIKFRILENFFKLN